MIFHFTCACGDALEVGGDGWAVSEAARQRGWTQTETDELKCPECSEKKMNEFHEAALRKHATPGLKRSQMSRYGKKWHLLETQRMTKEERDKLLDELYGVEDAQS